MELDTSPGDVSVLGESDPERESVVTKYISLIANNHRDWSCLMMMTLCQCCVEDGEAGELVWVLMMQNMKSKESWESGTGESRGSHSWGWSGCLVWS